MVPTVTLNSGYVMPVLGMGTFSTDSIPEDELVETLVKGIKHGHRHIDTAAIYGTEKAVGKAVSKAVEQKIVSSREELFITNGDEKTKKRASPIVNMEPLKTTVVTSDKKLTNPASEGEASPSNRKFNQELSSEEPLQNNTEGKQGGKKNSKSRDNQTKGSTTPNSKGTAASVASEKKKPSSDQKNESEILGGVSQATKRPNLVENIILGVALDGSKRTLPIDEEIEAKELVPIQNKDKKDGPKTNEKPNEKPNDSQTV